MNAATTGREAEMTEMISLDKLANDATQTRAGLRDGAIEEYAERIRNNESLEPALVFRHGDEYFLASGFHRREAYRRAGKLEMPCIVREGTSWDAIRAGIRDNQKHTGERLTRADRQHNVRLILQRGPRLSDRQIAKLAQVCHVTVGTIREELISTGKIYQLDTRVGCDGRERRVPIQTTAGSKRADPTREQVTIDPRDDVVESAREQTQGTSEHSALAPPKGDLEPSLTIEDFKKVFKFLGKICDLLDAIRDRDRRNTYHWHQRTTQLCKDLCKAIEEQHNKIFSEVLQSVPF